MCLMLFNTKEGNCFQDLPYADRIAKDVDVDDIERNSKNLHYTKKFPPYPHIAEVCDDDLNSPERNHEDRAHD